MPTTPAPQAQQRPAGRVAFLGLGRMGRVLAGHLVQAGLEVRVWNRSQGPAAELAAAGATAAASSAEAVEGADVVLTAFFGPDAVREAVLGAGLPFGADAVWVDVTTVAPADARAFADWAREHGVRYVHSPVIGSLGPARERALGVLVGGAPEDTERVLPLVALWADPERLQVLDDPAAAATGKLVANLALAVSFQGLVEAVRLGASGGLELEQVLTTLRGTGLGPIAAMKGANLRSGRFDDTQFSTDLLLKDTGLMLGTSRLPLPALTVAAQALLAAQRAGRGDDDFSVLAAGDLPGAS